MRTSVCTVEGRGSRCKPDAWRPDSTSADARERLDAARAERVGHADDSESLTRGRSVRHRRAGQLPHGGQVRAISGVGGAASHPVDVLAAVSSVSLAVLLAALSGL